MRIESKSHGDVTVLALKGDLDGVERGAAASLLRNAQGARNVVLNVRELRFIDVAGLRVLVEVERAVRAAGGRVALSEPSGLLRRILRTVGLDRSIPVFDRDHLAAGQLRQEAARPVPRPAEEAPEAAPGT